MKINAIKWLPTSLARTQPNGTIFLWKHSGGRIELCELIGNIPSDTSTKCRSFYDQRIKVVRQFKDAGVWFL